jgi:hypothetical protein
MSIQLVLSHYLAGLRERNELDALLPELLKEMGHSVLSRPQIGVAQAGVDIVSTMADENGDEEVFLYVVKFGDVGRGDFYGGAQAIDPSVREACNTFIRNRLPEPLRGLRKRIVLVSNGTLKQEAQDGFAALSHDVAERPQCSLEFWGTDQLTPLIEQHLFDETLLLANGKSDLRAALAGLEESNTAIHRFARFVESCFTETDGESTQSVTTRKHKFLKRCSTATMGWAVLLVWGESEGNLKPGCVSGEYLSLRMWAEASRAGFTSDKAFLERLEATIRLQMRALFDYFAKIMPQLLNRLAMLSYRPERVLYAELVLEELGRLSVLLLLLQRIPGQENLRSEIHGFLIRIVNEHPGCLLPVYDGQSIDLSLLLAALMGESDQDNAKRILAETCHRLHRALYANKYLPVDTDLLEDAVALNVTGTANPRDFFETSSLIPALATAAGLLGDEQVLKNLREVIQPLIEGVTLERWFPEVSLETLAATGISIQEAGVSRAISGIRATAEDEVDASLKQCSESTAPSAFNWHGTPWTVLVALSARLYRHPVPTWFLAEQLPPRALPEG